MFVSGPLLYRRVEPVWIFYLDCFSKLSKAREWIPYTAEALTHSFHCFFLLLFSLLPFFQVSKEGEIHEVPLKVAKMSALVSTTIDDDDDDDDDDEDNDAKEIPLPNVKDSVLKKVIEYCTHHETEEAMTQIQTPLKSSKIEDLVQPWYAEFVRIDQSLLFELVTAANFMDIKPLLDLTCLAVAISIKGKSASELRTTFNISNEFTPEEEQQVG